MKAKTLQEWTEFIDSLGVDEDERELLLSHAREMTANPVTPKSPITAGSTKLSTILPQPKPSPNRSAKSSKSAKFPKSAKVLPLPNTNLHINVELDECRNCDGTTCPKATMRWKTPIRSTYKGEPSWEHVPCRFAAQRAMRQQLRSSQIPSRYLGKTLADYHVDDDNRIAVKYAENALRLNAGAYFYGDCGTGKTFLASIVAQEFFRDGHSVIFVKVPQLLSDIQATFNGRGSVDEILDKLERAKLVVLDDFGMEKPTQWTGATMCRILDMRYDNIDAVTIITSNMSPGDLAYRLDNAVDGDSLNGTRIADRCRAICKPILFNGTTRR